MLTFIDLELNANGGMVKKGKKAGKQHFLLFIRPSKTGRIMLSPVVDGVPHSLSGAYLQDYASYGYET